MAYTKGFIKIPWDIPKKNIGKWKSEIWMVNLDPNRKELFIDQRLFQS